MTATRPVAERFRRLRKQLNLTQDEFAEKIGAKRNTVYNWESTGERTRKPDFDALVNIAERFGPSAAMYLLLGSDQQLERVKGATILDDPKVQAALRQWLDEHGAT